MSRMSHLHSVVGLQSRAHHRQRRPALRHVRTVLLPVRLRHAAIRCQGKRSRRVFCQQWHRMEFVGGAVLRQTSPEQVHHLLPFYNVETISERSVP